MEGYYYLVHNVSNCKGEGGGGGGVVSSTRQIQVGGAWGAPPPYPERKYYFGILHYTPWFLSLP